MATTDSTSLPAPRPVDNPLMQPVLYNGDTYATSQYFHPEYLAGHSDLPKKYRHHSHFVRVLQNIEAYPLYVERGDILRLIYEKKAPIPEWDRYVKSTGYMPITLMNRTAQVAMSHHLDDESNQQMSYAVNAKVAREAA